MNDRRPDADPAQGKATVARLLLAHRAELLGFVQARTRRHTQLQADDLVQQVATLALLHADELRDPAQGRAWLFRITRNLLADALRQRAPTPAGLDPTAEAHVGEDPAPDSTCQCVLARVQTLKPEYAELLRHVVLDERPVSGVAAELGISPGNAMVRLHRARAALRQRLEAHCGTRSLRECLSCCCDERGCCRPAAEGSPSSAP